MSYLTSKIPDEINYATLKTSNNCITGSFNMECDYVHFIEIEVIYVGPLDINDRLVTKILSSKITKSSSYSDFNIVLIENSPAILEALTKFNKNNAALFEGITSKFGLVIKEEPVTISDCQITVDRTRSIKVKE